MGAGEGQTPMPSIPVTATTTATAHDSTQTFCRCPFLLGFLTRPALWERLRISHERPTQTFFFPRPRLRGLGFLTCGHENAPPPIKGAGRFSAG